MSIEELNVKIEEEQKALDNIEEKKAKLEEKIDSKKKKIDDYKKMIQSIQYNQIDNQLEVLGLSKEELLNALMKGDLGSLQSKIVKE